MPFRISPSLWLVQKPNKKKGEIPNVITAEVKHGRLFHDPYACVAPICFFTCLVIPSFSTLLSIPFGTGPLLVVFTRPTKVGFRRALPRGNGMMRENRLKKSTRQRGRIVKHQLQSTFTSEEKEGKQNVQLLAGSQPGMVVMEKHQNSTPQSRRIMKQPGPMEGCQVWFRDSTLTIMFRVLSLPTLPSIGGIGVWCMFGPLPLRHIHRLDWFLMHQGPAPWTQNHRSELVFLDAIHASAASNRLIFSSTITF